MMDQQAIEAYLAKARESLDTAESEYTNQRYNSCANRCYYACFQAAIAALLQAGFSARDPSGRWGHGYVQATFTGQLINRRKLYPSSLRDALTYTREQRETADYEIESVTLKEATRALRRSREFVQAIQQQGDRGL